VDGPRLSLIVSSLCFKFALDLISSVWERCETFRLQHQTWSDNVKINSSEASWTVRVQAAWSPLPMPTT